MKTEDMKLGYWYVTFSFDEKDNPYYQHLLSIGYLYREVILCDDNKSRIIRENPPVYYGMPDNAVVKIKKEPNENPVMKESILCVETLLSKTMNMYLIEPHFF